MNIIHILQTVNRNSNIMFLKKSIAVLAAAAVIPSFNGLALASDIQAHADGATDEYYVGFHDT